MDGPNKYGFRWGQVLVTRLGELRGTRILRINGNALNEVTVYVSPTGRSIRVFKNGKELK